MNKNEMEIMNMSVGTSTSIFWGRCGACIKNRQNFHIEHIYIYLSVLYIISIIIKISKFFQCYCVSCIINFNQYAGNSLINNYYKFKNISLKSIKIMRRQSQQNISQITQISSDDECCSATTTSTAQILERVQSDKVTVTKPEEDRRRRTIIVEKKNGTFGFTIQSYGIHYKKEKEIEMITYVDYVDYDGPAYRAGMREGDVILSINGTDMEKADHKTLVNYIKKCDTRMRMVVLFEDCVRKVELHMRYIKLQNILETKMDELECLCIKERQLLEGKWKTHSLPARKKASHNNGTEPSALTPQGYYTFCRPTVSTEDVGKIAAQRNNKEPSTPPVVFTYQYLDNNYRYMLQPSTSSSGEYLLTFEPQRRDHHQGFIVKTPCDSTASINKQQHQQSSSSSTTTRSQQQYQENNKAKKGHGQCYSYGGHLCNPCININNNNNPSNNNGENTSLDAYDLASPCCDPHCIPGARRKSSRTQKNNNPQQIMRKRESKTETTQTDPQPQHQQQQRVRPHSQIASNNTHQNFTSTSSSSQQSSSSRRYFQMDTAAVAAAGLMSQCSLHSCTSSEISNNINPATSTNNVGAESIISANSYTTSLSTDTLYWDGSNADTVSSSRQLLLTPKSTSSTIITERFPQQQNHQLLYSSSSHHHNNHHQHHHHHHQEPIYVQYGQVQAKPKSWDNLTTKSFGGYGFGYGYIEANNKGNNLKTNTNPRNPPANNKQNNQQIHQYVRVIENSSKGIINIPQYTPHTQRRWQPSNKSTESLLSIPKYSNENISDNNSINNSSSCECFEPVAAAASSSSSASSPHHPAHHSPPPPPPSEGGNNECRFSHPTSRQSILSPTTADPNLGYYSIARNKPSKSVENSNNQLQASASINNSEATRL